MSQKSVVPPSLDPLDFNGLRNWSLLLFISLVLFLFSSRLPIYSLSDNMAHSTWMKFYEDNGESTASGWPGETRSALTFDEQMILEVRRTWDTQNSEEGLAGSTLRNLRSIAGITTHLSEGFAVLLVLFLAWGITYWRPQLERFLTPLKGALAGAISAGILARLLKIGFGRGRPNELIYRSFPDWEPMSLENNHNSLPSGHATATGVLVMLLSMLFPRWTPLWCVLGVWLCSTRVFTADHWPSDTVIGFILGAFFVVLWTSILERQEERNQSSISSR